MQDARAAGIDVSHFHRVTDWELLLNAGLAFFGAKATQGPSYVDPTFRDHRDGFRRFPWVCGIWYHFATPGDPVKQAGHLLDAAGALRDNERLALDVEGDAPPDVPWIESFVGELLRAWPDRRPLIYTSNRIWRDVMGGPSWPGAIAADLWAPRYSSDEPKLPVDRDNFPVWPRWSFWQNTDRRTTPGVDGPCDGNLFRGTIGELQLYAKLAGT